MNKLDETTANPSEEEIEESKKDSLPREPMCACSVEDIQDMYACLTTTKRRKEASIQGFYPPIGEQTKP
jgi:hypothetical protein